MADDCLVPLGGAAVSKGDTVDVVDAMADVVGADFAVGVRDVLVADVLAAPFPLA